MGVLKFMIILAIAISQVTDKSLAISFYERGACEDYNRLCPGWAENEECENNPAYMNKFCKKSCGLCGDPCKSYKILPGEKSRLTSNPASDKCDNRLKTRWYRLSRNEDTKMPESCVPKESCGTYAPGWLNGKHPTIAEGIVNREVCFSWENEGCCEWSTNIKVKNCGGFYVYWLKKTPECYLRYCIAQPGKPAVKPSTKPTMGQGSLTCGIRRKEVERRRQVILELEEKRIVGGSVVATNQDWPWQAGLKETWDGKIFCGGSLINNQWVVTAAHCISDLVKRGGCRSSSSPVQVVLGEFDQRNVEGHEVDKDVAKICMHPKYESGTEDYDIALLQLKTPVEKFNATMSPVCLPESSTDFPKGTTCTVTGFGHTKESGKLSNKLRQVDLPLRPMEYCKKKYKGYTVTDRMLCAGDVGGKDSCQGDSGGPLVCKDEQSDRFILWGVVSWGVGCAQKGNPGVYADVKYFLPWIEETMKQAR